MTGPRWAPPSRPPTGRPLAGHQVAVTWRLLAHNPASHASPPPVPRTEVVALAPEQVAVLLDAAARTTSPWLGPWTVLAAATGARNGELCGLEWADLDLDTGTIQFRQALTIIDPTVLSNDADGDGGAGEGGGRKELAVGPLKSAASNAILTLPPFAVQALRSHRRQHHRLRLALGQPTTVGLRWVEPGQHHRRPTAPRRRRCPRPTGVHPPAAPDRAPVGWGDRGRVRPSGAGRAGGVGWASGGGKVEGKPALEPDLTGRPATALLLVRGYVAGTGFEPV